MRKLSLVLTCAVLVAACGSPPVDDGDIERGTMAAYTDTCMLAFEEKDLPGTIAKAAVDATGATLSHYLEGIGIGLVNNCSKLSGAALSASVAGVVDNVAYELSPSDIKVEATTAPTANDIYYDWFQWTLRRAKADQAWATTTGSHNTVVAVIDTGVAFNHPDLAPNKVAAYCFTTANLIDGVPCSAYPQYHWHGTHVAGTVAAAFGGGKAVGVGPNLGIASYNVFELFGNQVLAPTYNTWAALWDAANKGYKVANLSLGSYFGMPLGWYSGVYNMMWDRVATYAKQKGLTVVAAAGNNGAYLNGPSGHYPSDISSVVSVGSTGIRPDPEYPQAGAYDVLAYYSNYGAEVTLAAPGGDWGPYGNSSYYGTLSTSVAPNPGCAATESCPYGYAFAVGTSMASPHVAGAAGLIAEVKPKLNPGQVYALLKKTASKLPSQVVFGSGMLDVAAAVK
jgi:subtilisin family serine protease